MPSAAVEAAFRTRLANGWTETVILGVNEVFSPPSDGSPYTLIQYPIVSSSRPVLSKRRFEEGAARIVINAPVGAGLLGWLAKADTISALFRGDNLKFDGVEVFEPSSPIINDDNEDGNYFSLAVVVPYRYQFDAA